MASTLPNLGLKVWDSPTDPYNSVQLADNFWRIEEHDHTPGRGRPLTAAALPDAMVTTIKLADSAVTTAKIADQAVTDAKLATRIVRGQIDGGGGILWGTGFTVVRNLAGWYTVTWDVPFDGGNPAVVASSGQPGTITFVEVIITGTSNALIRFRDTTSTLVDTPFTFVAISAS